MVTTTKKILAALAAGALALGLSACSDVITGKDHNESTQASQEPQGDDANDAVSGGDDANQASQGDEPSVSALPSVEGGFGEKPVITPGEGQPGTKLTVKDLVEGDGKVVEAGNTVKVNYTGVTWEGEEFDSSFQRGEPIEFPLDSVIEGWKTGIPGHKVGSRLLMVIPPDMAYGPAGAGHELSGKTLVFVVDILDAK